MYLAATNQPTAQHTHIRTITQPTTHTHTKLEIPILKLPTFHYILFIVYKDTHHHP